MKVLVTSASRHGSTTEIATEIASTLTAQGVAAVCADIEDVTDLPGYDAVILGSAIYAGHWLGPAKDFAERLGAELADRPVWLFSSGPIGDKPTKDPVEATHAMSTAGAREHRIFSGKLDKETLGFAEKAIMRVVRAPEGDYRDWSEIHSWAQGIADELKASHSGSVVR